MGIHRTWASGLEPFMGPPVGRASAPRAWPPSAGGQGIFSPKRPEARLPGLLGGLSARSSAIFHIREPCALNTISNIIGLAVTAGHRPLTRTREQEPMGRPRRTRTREPPGGAQPSPAQDSWPGSSRRETRELEDGWMARTRAHPPRRLAMARGESEIAEAHCPASPTPSPQKRLSPGVGLRQPGWLGRRTPAHSPPQSSSGGGANVDSRILWALLGCRWFWLPSLVCRALYPSHPPLPSRGGFRGLWAAQLSGKPAASHRQ
jgi:hypothetical protein